MTETIDRRYRAIGGAAEFFASEDKEVLCESGAMTGKTHSLLRKADYTARQYPGCRQFFARDTRKSMTESVLEEFESSVLWPGHPAITGTATRGHRSVYTYPNGSEIALFGLDDPGDHMSTQYDRGYIFEATQIKSEAWEYLLTRMRKGRTPYHQLVADCNPGPRGHWLNKRFPADRRIIRDDDGNVVSTQRRILYRHEDNPRLFDYERGEWTPFGREYIYGTLGTTTGARRERLLYHRWVSEEGQVWPEFDPETHCIYAKDVPTLKVHYVSMDFGYNAAGCVQVWGFDADERGYRVAEILHRGWTIDQWADQLEKLQAEFGFFRGVADAARPDDIDLLNKRLRLARGVDSVFVRCDKSKGIMHGIDIMRDNFRKDGSGKPRIYLVKGASREIDENLRAMRRPLCWEDEIDSYVFKKNEDGKEIKDEPDKGSPHDACDTARYLFTYLLGRSIVEPEYTTKYPPGSYGALLDYEDDEDDEAA